MRVRIKDFEQHFESVKREVDKSSDAKMKVRRALEFSAYSGIPVTVVYSFLIRLGIEVDFLQERINSILKDRGETLE